MKNTKKGKKPPKSPQHKSPASKQHEIQDPALRLPGDGIHGEVETKDEQIAALQDQLTQQNDKQREDRYWFGAVVIFLIDCLVFPSQAWFMVTVTIVLQLSAGVYFARRMGLERAAVAIDTVMRWIMKHVGRGE